LSGLPSGVPLSLPREETTYGDRKASPNPMGKERVRNAVIDFCACSAYNVNGELDCIAGSSPLIVTLAVATLTLY